MASSILLLLAAPLVDPTRHRWVYVGAWFGLLGTLASLIAYYKPLDGSNETITLFFVSTVLITVVLGCIGLSGFKPK